MTKIGQVGNSPESGQESKRMRSPMIQWPTLSYEDLRRIALSRKREPKDLLAKILAVEIKFGIKMGDVRKPATILRAGERDYA